MRNAPKNGRWDEKVRAAFAARWQNAPHSTLAYYEELWAEHLASGLADAELVADLAGGSEFAMRPRIWEMLLARHLRACGHLPHRIPKNAPDYSVVINGTTIWVEAVSPKPGANPPKGWLEGGAENEVNEVPHDWILSRWTGALKEKHEKGVKYELGGVIQPNEAYVIAIDGSQLSRISMAHGKSQRPFVMEAVFPVGPLIYICSNDDGRLLRAENSIRFSFKNSNNADIQTEPFFREEFRNVSAVLGCCPSPPTEHQLPVQVIYNPLARVSVAPGSFGDLAEEWRALVVEDEGERFWQVERVIR